MKVVLIGLGMVADTHLAAINDASDVTLSGVIGRETGKTREFAEKAETVLGYPVQAWTNIDQALAQEFMDFAVLATPPDARFNLINALAAKKVPVLMEKPIERTFAAAQEIVDKLTSESVLSAVCFQNRTRSASRALHRAVTEGALGQIVMADIRVPWWREQSYYDEPGRGTYARDGGGVLINQAIHTIDLALWILGPWKNVLAKLHKTILHRMESEDWASAVFETNGGVVGTLAATTSAYPGGPESITIHGSDASAHLEAGVLTITNRDGNKTVTGSASMSGGGANPMAFSHVWHQRVIEDFSNCVISGTQPLVPTRSALMSHAVIDAMERSHATGQRVSVEQV